MHEIENVCAFYKLCTRLNKTGMSYNNETLVQFIKHMFSLQNKCAIYKNVRTIENVCISTPPHPYHLQGSIQKRTQ